jgi:hypothetical protein
MNDKNFDNDEFQGNVSFLGNILDKTSTSIHHMDSQINIIIGISSAIFLYSSAQTNTTNHLVFPILSIFSAISIIIGLFAIHPPRFMRKKGQAESLLYNKRISSYSSSKEYSERLGEVLGDITKIKEHYAREIYNMNSFYYRPKRKLYRWSRDVLLWGMILAAAAYILGPIL